MRVNKAALARVSLALVAVIFLTGSLHQIRKGGSSAPDFACSSNARAEVNIPIANGATGSAIAQQLLNAGVVKSSTAFFRVAVSDNRSSRIAPGVHRIEREICAAQALDQLLDPERIIGLIKISEGAWNDEIFKALSKSGFDRAEIKDAAANVVLPQGFSYLEGLLFPAQYSFAPSATASDAIALMLERGKREISRSGIAASGGDYSPSQLLVMASIIQAEGDPKDFAQVSRVIRNRLALGMPLQMDSTVHYIKKVRGEIFLSTQSTLLKSTYNTYSKTGLPPGPIGNPGFDAMYGAANPANGDWLYFITVAPGDTRFTNSFDQFNNWKLEYKRNLRDGLFRSKK